MVQKGWGFGSGISIFILAGVAQNIFWSMFAPVGPLESGRMYGVFVAIAQTLGGGGDIGSLFIRSGGYPGILGFIATLAVFLIVIYAEGVRVELPISHADYKGFRSRYPIKLLYVSNLPVIFASALFANVYFFSQLFWSMYNKDLTNPWLNLLGQFKIPEGSTSPQIVNAPSLVYYVTAPRSLLQVQEDPIRAVIYVAILVGFCIIFSLTWLEVGGLGPRSVAEQLVDSGMHIPGYRRSSKPIELLLKRYITPVTILGAIIVGVIAGMADFFGVFGSGMGILLSVGIIYQYYQLLIQERAAEMFPAFRRVLGE